MRSPHQVGDVPPQSDMIFYFLLSGVDALPRQTQPQHEAAEGVDGADAVEVVDRDAGGFDIVVSRLGCGHLHHAPAHGGMEKTDSDRVDETVPARLDGG